MNQETSFKHLEDSISLVIIRLRREIHALAALLILYKDGFAEGATAHDRNDLVVANALHFDGIYSLPT